MNNQLAEKWHGKIDSILTTELLRNLNNQLNEQLVPTDWDSLRTENFRLLNHWLYGQLEWQLQVFFERHRGIYLKN